LPLTQRMGIDVFGGVWLQLPTLAPGTLRGLRSDDVGSWPP
jgi:hypothetical protein